MALGITLLAADAPTPSITSVFDTAILSQLAQEDWALADHRVVVVADDLGAAREAVQEAGLRAVAFIEGFRAVVATGGVDQVRGLGDDSRVRRVEAAWQFASTDTSQTAIRARRVHPIGNDGPGFDGSGVTIAVVDSGIDAGHVAFTRADGSRVVARSMRNACLGPLATIVGAVADVEACFVDDPTRNGAASSGSGHGTHVASIAAGAARRNDQGLPLVGTAPGATVIDVGVGVGRLIAGTEGLAWVLRHHQDPCGNGECPPIRVVNASFGSVGGSEYDPEATQVLIVEQLVAEGVTVVFAAGNDGGTPGHTTNGPGASPVPGVIMVASYDDMLSGTRRGVISDFSSRGTDGRTASWPDVAAPGSHVTAACWEGYSSCYDRTMPAEGPLSGTSMAAPHVSGAVALMLQADPTLTPARLETALEATATPVLGTTPTRPGDRRPDDRGATTPEAGHGLIDAAAAVARVGGERFGGGCEAVSSYLALDSEADNLSPLAVRPLGRGDDPGGLASATDLLDVSLDARGDGLVVVVTFAGPAGSPSNRRVSLGARMFGLLVDLSINDREATLSHASTGGLAERTEFARSGVEVGAQGRQLTVHFDRTVRRHLADLTDGLLPGWRALSGDLKGEFTDVLTTPCSLKL